MAVRVEEVEVVAEGVVKRLGRVRALDGASFAARGRVVALLGTNGSGKTTLLSIVAGLRRPSAGTLRVNGVEPYRDREWAAANVKAVFEKPLLPYPLTVGYVLKVANKLWGCAEVFNMWEFGGNKLWQLSSGQAQALGIYLALACHRGIAALDEPFSHLDKSRAAELAQAIRRRGGVIFTTHNSLEVPLADYVVVLHKGKVAWSGERGRFYLPDLFKVVADGDLPCPVLGAEGVYQVVKCPPSELFNLMRAGVVYAVERLGVY